MLYYQSQITLDRKEDFIMAYNVSDNANLWQLKAGLQAAKDYADAKIAALPKEQFLDQTKTELVQSFAFDATKYAGAANPNLEGKQVLVLALKGVDNVTKAETITYQFIDVSTLVIDISDKADKVENPTAGHILTVDANGNPVDSGIKFATDDEFNEMLAEIFPSSGE